MKINSYALVLAIILTPISLFAQDVAELFSVQGEVEKLNAANWSPLAQGAKLAAGDAIRTKSASRAAILFNDGVLVRLNENSAFTIEVATNESTQPLAIEKGEAFFLSRQPKRFPEIKTPVVSAAVRGTEFLVKVTEQTATISVLDGVVLASNNLGSAELRGNEEAYTERGKAPVKRALVDPVGSVQWAFFYPPVLEESSPVNSLLESGQIDQALQVLSKTKSSKDPSVSSVEYDTISSLRALQLNKVSDAHNMVERASSRAPDSVGALTVYSLVEQAALKLSEAKKLNDRARALAPRSTYLAARAIELALAEGDTEGATPLVEQALALNDSDPYILSAVGFYHLTRYEADQALELFTRAIASDQSSGLFHFGRGLALIRKGKLEAGREELAKAAVLEPNISIYRSYLGKAFFEEEREELAAHEYDRAIALDAEDPTPFLYRAYNHLSNNRPVDAIRDVEKSIELNDNRAIYRSSMLLDKDTAVRSAGLAEVFNTLGFARVAQIEAIKSINRDYSNYSAHRLLGESYRALIFVDPLVSERKISTLLSPLSLNLFRSGSAQAGLNEYNALFDRPEHRTALEFEGQTGDDVIAPSISQSGRGERYGYLGEFDSGFANGSRENKFLRDYRVRGVGQYQLSYRDRIIAEGRYLNRELEGSNNNFDHSASEDDEFEIGYHREISAGSGFLAQAAYRDDRNHRRDLDERSINLSVTSSGTEQLFLLPTLLNQNFAEEFQDVRGSLQYYRNDSLLSLVLGAEFYGASPERSESSEIIDDDFFLFPELGRELNSEYDENLYSQDAYLYTTWHLADWIDASLGGSYSNLDFAKTETLPLLNEKDSASRWNPKLGVTLYPRSDLTIRTAYFESLQKAAFEDVGTLEPTLVGGLNQLFTDFPGAQTRNYGGGIDWKAAGSTYLGVDALHRDTIEPATVVDTNYFINFDSFNEDSTTNAVRDVDFHFNQDFVNAYWYQIISKQVVGALDYGFDLFENTNPDIRQEIRNHRVAATFRYFDDSGWFTFSRATWRHQKAEQGIEVGTGTEHLWLIDTGFGYRIPDRHGSVTLELLNIFDQKFALDQIQGLSEEIHQGFSARLVGNINF